MSSRIYISPLQQLVAEVLLFLAPMIVALWFAPISTEWRIVGVVLALIAAIIINYILAYSPRVTFQEQKTTEFMDHYLEVLINDFRYCHNLEFDIRANVMMPQSGWTISTENGLSINREKYLKIAYCAGGGPDKDIETHEGGRKDETQTKWNLDRPIEGNCTRAYLTGEPKIAQREPAKDTWPNTTQNQDTATRRVNSVLSVPITKPSSEKPIAILNIDSPVGTDENNFSDPEILKWVSNRYADQIGIIMPEG